MNNFFASLAVVIVLAVISIFAAGSFTPLWENVDLQVEDVSVAGACYIYTDVRQCEPGNGAGCGATLCNWHSANQRWTCPVDTNWLGYPVPQKVSKAEIWYPDVKTAEHGSASYISLTTHCTESQTCEGCVAAIDVTDNNFYCRRRNTSDSDTHNGKQLTGGLCH